MSIERGDAQRLLARQYNKAVSKLPTYTLNKYRYIGQMLPTLLSEKKGGESIRIVELGCGNKGLAETYILPKLNNFNVDYFGVDDNLGLKPRPNIVADITSLPLSNANADVILCLDVIEHLGSENILQVLGQINRIAKPNALVLISIPSMYNLDRFQIPSIQFGTHVTKQFPQEWLRVIEKYITVCDTMGVGVLEVIPFLPQLLKMLSKDFPISVINKLYRGLRKLDLGEFDPVIYSAGLNRLPVFKEYCDGFLIIGRKSTKAVSGPF